MPEQETEAGQASGDPYRAGYERTQQLIVTTGTDVAGHDIVQYLAIVRGIVVRATSIGKGIVGSFKALAGGNIREFTEVCEAARHEAYQQMVEHAREVGADAVIAMRYDAGEFTAGVTEVLAYGTAVKLMPRIPT